MVRHLCVRHRIPPEKKTALPLSKGHCHELRGQYVAPFLKCPMALQNARDRPDLVALELDARALTQFVAAAAFALAKRGDPHSMRRQ